MRTLFAALVVCCGCAATPGAGPIHAPPGLDSREGAIVDLATDLPPPTAIVVLDRLDKTERILYAHPFWHGEKMLPRVRVVVLGEESRFREVARSHDVQDPNMGAFACSAGEVVIRFRPEEWGMGPTEGWFTSPRSAPVSEALFRQRLEERYGNSFIRTRVEDGCARAFSEQAAIALGEGPEAARRARDDLLDAYLPLFLGGERALKRTALAMGSDAEERGSKRSQKVLGALGLDYAVARFLVESDGGKRLPLLERIFARASQRHDHEEVTLEKDEEQLDADEDAFEKWLRDQTVAALLDAIASEPVPAARWEARSALRLIAGMDLDDDPAASPDERARRIGRARLEAKKLPTVRFTEEFDDRLLATRRGHGGLEKLVAEAKRELDRRAGGYGHAALEEGRARLGQALQERLTELSRRAS